MNAIRLFFFYLNALSIDIAVSAAIMFLSVNKVMDIQTRPELLVLLIIGTFLVYWFDHLLDIQIYGKNISPRHLFLSEIKKNIYAISLVFMLLGCALVYKYFSVRDLVYSLLLSVLLLVYLLFHKKLNRFYLFKKEFLISFLYSISVCFQAFLYKPLNGISFFTFVVFTTLHSVLMVASIEWPIDQHFGISNAFSHSKWKVYINAFLIGLPILTIVFIATSSHIKSGSFYLVLLIIQLIHALFFLFHKPNDKNDFTYRIISEWSFCLPGFILFIP